MKESELTEEIIGAAIEVHRHWGPGLYEEIYERSLYHELRLRGSVPPWCVSLRPRTAQARDARNVSRVECLWPNVRAYGVIVKSWFR